MTRLPNFLTDHAVEVSRVTSQLDEIGCIGLVVLDACRTPQFPGWPEMKGGSSELFGLKSSGASGLFIAYAAQDGQPAETLPQSGMSVFTYNLINQLNHHSSVGSGLNDIFDTIQTKVFRETGRRQRPHTSNQLVEVRSADIHLVPRPENMEKCPTDEVLPSTKQQLATSVDELARRVYMAVLATEAVYYPPAERASFLEGQTRTFSRFLMHRQHPDSEHVVVMDIATSNTIIVAYRGTADLADLWTDVKYPAVPVLGGKIHKGFFDRCREYDRVLPLREIARWLEEGKHVVMTGHSLGGAIAMVNTLRLFEEETLDSQLQKGLACITFASPLVGDKALQSNVNKKGYAKHFFTYVYETDIVPRILLLKEDLQSKLQTGLKGIPIIQWATSMATDLLKNRFKGWLSAYIGEGAAGYVADVPGQLGAWAWQEFNPPYVPFGAYYFCKGGQVKSSDDDDIVKAFMQQSEPNLESLMNHEMKRYASALEALRGK